LAHGAQLLVAEAEQAGIHVSTALRTKAIAVAAATPNPETFGI